jgi:hypothetical protein
MKLIVLAAGYTLCDVRVHTVIVEELMAARLQRLTRPQPQGQSANDHQAYCMSKPVKYLVSWIPSDRLMIDDFSFTVLVTKERWGSIVSGSEDIRNSRTHVL